MYSAIPAFYSLVRQAASKIQEVFCDPKTLEEARFSPRFFTRIRKLPFYRLLFFLLRSGKGASQGELDSFFRELSGDQLHCSQQALSKQRSHFDESPFKKAFTAVRDLDYHFLDENNLLKTKYGMKIVAIDGSDTELPNMPEPRQEFGTTGRKSASPTARESLALDVLNDRILDAVLSPFSTGERDLALQHIDSISQLTSLSDTLFIMDRGYPSLSLFLQLKSSGARFLMRVKSKFNRHIDGMGLGKHFITLWGDSPEDYIVVLVVKLLLPGGEIETLITNFFHKSIDVYKELYFLRWPVETKYDLVKNKLELTNFTGYSSNIIRQDFWITMLLAYLTAVMKTAADEVVSAWRDQSSNKHEYQTNTNNLIRAIKERVRDLLFAKDEHSRMSCIMQIISIAVKCVVPKRPGRHAPRNKTRRKTKFHHNKKSNL